MLHEFVNLLNCEDLTSLPEAEPYVKIINILCVRLIDRSDPTNVICALIELLYDSSPPNTSSPRYVELVMKCSWKIIKIIPQVADELDYDAILLELHKFFSQFPTSFWKQQPIDTPNRTMKTILHSMTRVKGQTLLSHFSLIQNPNSSEMYGLLMKMLKMLKVEENNKPQQVVVPMLKKEPVQNPLSWSKHQLLREIFKKIGVKETSKEGLLLLYEFKEQHPESDYDPFLKKSSPFFQQYIYKGLEEIAEQKRNRNQSKITSDFKNNGNESVSSIFF